MDAPLAEQLDLSRLTDPAVAGVRDLGTGDGTGSGGSAVWQPRARMLRWVLTSLSAFRTRVIGIRIIRVTHEAVDLRVLAVDSAQHVH